MMRRINRVICTGIVEVAALCVFISMLIESADSIGTKIFGMPLPGAHEFTIAFLVLIIFGGMPQAQFTKSHIKITLIYGRMGKRGKALLDFIASLVGFWYLTLLTWQNAVFAKSSLEIREYAQGLFRFPVYPVKIVIVIGLGWMAVQLFINIFESGAKLVGPDKGGSSP